MRKSDLCINKSGHAFVEVIVVVGLTLLILSVLVTGTVNGLKSSTFSSQKSQATALAQEGIEYTRKKRDESWVGFYAMRNSTQCVDKQGVWTALPTCSANIDATFTRTITLAWDTVNEYMNVTSTVTWQDGSQVRKSEIKTILTQWR